MRARCFVRCFARYFDRCFAPEISRVGLSGARPLRSISGGDVLAARAAFAIAPAFYHHEPRCRSWLEHDRLGNVRLTATVLARKVA